MVYRDCQPAPTHPAQAAARPTPQGWYAQAQQPAQKQAQTQPSPQAQTPAPAPPGACFRCGMHGHWARDCAGGGQGRAPSVASSVASLYRGGFSTVGSQSLYTAHSTGRTYEATAPPPYPCFRCGCNHWALGGPCPAPPARHPLPRLPGPFRPGRPQCWPTAKGPSAHGGERPASEGSVDDKGGGALNLRYAGPAVDSLCWGNYMEEPSRWPSGGGPRVPWSVGPRSSGM